jgi:hypothetical protein
MVSRFKRLVARLPYPLLLRLLVSYRRLVEVPRERRRVEHARIPALDAMDLAQYKRSDTLFVLAGGSSINQISPERWSAIAAHDTVGFNLWLYHPFVPRMYFFENIWAANPSFEPLKQGLTARAADYTDVLKIVMDFDPIERPLLNELPDALRPNLYAVFHDLLPARNAAEFAYGLEYWKKQGAFAPATRFSRLFKHCSTLTALIAFAARLQYRNIVLCGVDLNDGRYFYQDPQLYPATARLEFLPRVGRHMVDSPAEWRVPASQTVTAMKRQVLEPAGISIYVENALSGLHPEIPLAPESLFRIPSGKSGALGFDA